MKLKIKQGLDENGWDCDFYRIYLNVREGKLRCEITQSIRYTGDGFFTSEGEEVEEFLERFEFDFRLQDILRLRKYFNTIDLERIK